MTIKLCVTTRGSHYLIKNDLVLIRGVEPIFFRSIPELLCKLHTLKKWFNCSKNTRPVEHYEFNERTVLEVDTFEELGSIPNTHPELFI